MYFVKYHAVYVLFFCSCSLCIILFSFVQEKVKLREDLTKKQIQLEDQGDIVKVCAEDGQVTGVYDHVGAASFHAFYRSSLCIMSAHVHVGAMYDSCGRTS